MLSRKNKSSKVDTPIMDMIRSSFLNLVVLGGFLFGIILFFVKIGITLAIPSVFSTVIAEGSVCLIGCLGGFYTVKFYFHRNNEQGKLSQCIYMGLGVGAMMAFVLFVFMVIMVVFDPEYAREARDKAVSMIEQQQMLSPQEKEQQIQKIYEEYEYGETIQGRVYYFLFSGLIFGILNMFSGMIAYRVYVREKVDE